MAAWISESWRLMPPSADRILFWYNASRSIGLVMSYWIRLFCKTGVHADSTAPRMSLFHGQESISGCNWCSCRVTTDSCRSMILNQYVIFFRYKICLFAPMEVSSVPFDTMTWMLSLSFWVMPLYLMALEISVSVRLSFPSTDRIFSWYFIWRR